MTSNIPPKDSENKESTKPKEQLENMVKKPKEQLGNIVDFAKSNVFDTISYALLIVGIIWLFFQPFYAGLLIGVIIGIYFSSYLSNVVRNINTIIDGLGMVKSLILGGGVLAFFITSPGIFIGAAIAVALKEVISRASGTS